MGSIARRVQGELRRTTGHYYPLHQVVTSIYDIDNHKTQGERFPFMPFEKDRELYSAHGDRCLPPESV